MSFFKLFEKYFVIVFLLAIVIGFYFPKLGAFSFITPFMFALAIFLASLKVDFKLFIKHLKDYKYFVKKFFIIKIIAPLLVFFITSLVAPQFALAGLLIIALPSGMSNIIFSDIFKGNNALTLLFTVSTHLLSPIMIPLLVFLVSFQTIGFDYIGMFFSLAEIVLAPVILAYLVKKKFEAGVGKFEGHLSGINILLIAGIVVIIIAQNSGKLTDFYSFLWQLGYAAIIFFALSLFGFFVAGKESRENKIAISLSTYHTNTILGLFIASTYFSLEVVSVIIAAEFVITGYQAVYKMLLDKNILK